MNPLEILRIGPFDGELAERLGRELAGEFHVPFVLGPLVPEPTFAYHPERGQFHSSEILAWLEKRAEPERWRTLAVTDADLYIPILTFVFGEARLGPGAAIVSTHRLRQEFYGLPPDPNLLLQRLVRESIHELGHTLGLRHCEDYGCAMAGSPGIEWIDLKGSTLCDFCKTRVGLLAPATNR